MHEFEFEIHVIGEEWDLLDDNVDVEITFPNGKMYSAVFFTLKNIEALFDKYKNNGECLNGTYFWTVDMIIVKRLDFDTMSATIKDLLRTGEFKTAARLMNISN